MPAPAIKTDYPERMDATLGGLLHFRDPASRAADRPLRIRAVGWEFLTPGLPPSLRSD